MINRVLVIAAITGGCFAAIYALYRVSKNPPTIFRSSQASRGLQTNSLNRSVSGTTLEAQLQALFEKSIQLRAPKDFDSRKAFASLPRSAACCICKKCTSTPKAKMSINWHRQGNTRPSPPGS
jgi:hypothetical protein